MSNSDTIARRHQKALGLELVFWNAALGSVQKGYPEDLVPERLCKSRPLQIFELAVARKQHSMKLRNVNEFLDYREELRHLPYLAECRGSLSCLKHWLASLSSVGQERVKSWRCQTGQRATDLTLAIIAFYSPVPCSDIPGREPVRPPHQSPQRLIAQYRRSGPERLGKLSSTFVNSPIASTNG